MFFFFVFKQKTAYEMRTSDWSSDVCSSDLQSLVPYYAGNLNFVPSDVGNFWHVFIRWPKTNRIFEWSSLVYSMDIGEVCRQLELLMLDGDGLPRDPGLALGPSLESTVKELVQFHHQDPDRKSTRLKSSH